MELPCSLAASMFHSFAAVRHPDLAVVKIMDPAPAGKHRLRWLMVGTSEMRLHERAAYFQLGQSAPVPYPSPPSRVT